MFDNLEPVTITPKAAKEIKNIMASKNIPSGYGLRIGMQGGGGCGAGMTYQLGFDKKKEDDIEYHFEDITVYIAKKHTMYLLGLQVDFYDESDARGFTFVNPKQKQD